MNVQRLIDMDDDEFAEAVSQAAKSRRDFPAWWRAVLHPDVIDETEDVIREAKAAAERQALTPERYPHARGFARKMDGLLAEITLERIVSSE